MNIFGPPSRQVFPGCPQGWISFGQSCYWFSNDVQQWENARADCQRRGSDLVIIKSRAEHNFINHNRPVLNHSLWIGARGNSTDPSVWRWVNGEVLSFAQWAPNEPRIHNSMEKCVAIQKIGDTDVRHYTGDWDDQLCNKKNRYTCEFK